MTNSIYCHGVCLTTETAVRYSNIYLDILGYLAKFVHRNRSISLFMPVTTNTYLLLGTNMGDRVSQLSRARGEIAGQIGPLRRSSSIYETDAWGNEDQPPYLNQVVSVDTTLKPLALLYIINAIEKQMGRIRTGKWESRVIDIDILYYSDRIIDEVNLQVPHPHLPNRRFALAPLQEIAPLFVHPISGKTTTELLNQTPDQLTVRLFNPDTYEQHEI